MPTPLDDHGGSVPSKFHTIEYADKLNKVILIVRIEKRVSSLPFMQILSTCMLNMVEKIYFVFPKTLMESLHISPSNLKRLHPLLQEIVTDDNDIKLFETFSSISDHATPFYYFLNEESLIHPNFWKILKHADLNNYVFLDEKRQEHTLLCKNAIKTYSSDYIASYSSVYDDFTRIYESIVCALEKQMKTYLQEITIDVSNNFTPLCRLAFSHSTDKSVYNIMTHRHPYTPIYHLFFNQFQDKPLKIGEVGVLNGASILMWNDYFKHPSKIIHGFDIEKTALEKIKDIQNTKGFLVDAGNSLGLKLALNKACTDDKELYDILIEDASHRLEHQLIFLRDAINFVKSGGMLVIEDIFRDICPSRFEEMLELISDQVRNAILIKPEHIFRHSPGWNNDQILIVFKQ